MGKFLPGNPGGPGRPPKPVEDAKQSVLLELFDEKAERAIIQNMIANAKRKGVIAAPSAIAASTWLWDRKYGKVKDQMELSGAIEVRKGYQKVSPDDWDDQPADSDPEHL
jgi:hypothetical protein